MPGRHARTSPRTEPPPVSVTKPNPVLRERKPRSIFKKIMIVIVVLVTAFIVLGALGSLLPQKADKGAPGPDPARAVNVADILRSNSPAWYVAEHIVAVVRPDDGGKSVMLVNSGKGTASAVIPLSRLGVSAQSVTVWNIWAATVSPPHVHAIRVVLAPGTAEYLILK